MSFAIMLGELVLCLFILGQSQAFIFGGGDGKWNALKVTWGANPLDSNIFNSLPRTVGEAADAGFVKDASCSGSNRFLGNRYIKNRDTAVMLLYDKRGYIAGIQVGIPKGLPRHYPSSIIRPPFVDDGDKYILTAYFVEPSTICSNGRSSAEYESQGTGTGLYIQNSSNPLTGLIKIPSAESGMTGTNWVKGKCFKTMGMHYWYNIRSNMNCDEFQPVFLLYNKGKLNAFGWALNAELQSSRFEHPPQEVIGLFMEQPPVCLSQQGTLSTMHIYMTDNPLLQDWC